jgi:ribosomal protein S18 acetylase RimI-like enzyme
MIQKIDHRDRIISTAIRNVFQVSYAVEATLLKAVNFPPLQRELASFIHSENNFYGYFKDTTLAAVIEIKQTALHTHIQSLVVVPSYFRQGIGKELMEFVFNLYGSNLFMVETGLANIPAIELYKSLGFKEVKQWDTAIGVRKIRFEKSKNTLYH